uniref:CHK kinase-like domain-containing protein n=1 Tax=Trichogramma kaykai TaxID=54128 RepID=A0ABD2WFC1_9HYME
MSKSEEKTLLIFEDVQKAVRNAIGLDAHLVDYNFKSLSGDKVGFAGSHQFLNVEVIKNGKKLALCFFMKIFPYDVPLQVAMIKNCKLFFKESKFYESILPKLMTSVKNKYWSALCYLSKENVIILDNMKDKYFELKGMSLCETYLKSALKTLALMHASVMIAEKKLGQSFLEVYPEIFQEAVWTKQTKFYDWYRYEVDAAVSVDLDWITLAYPKFAVRCSKRQLRRKNGRTSFVTAILGPIIACSMMQVLNRGAHL